MFSEAFQYKIKHWFSSGRKKKLIIINKCPFWFYSALLLFLDEINFSMLTKIKPSEKNPMSLYIYIYIYIYIYFIFFLLVLLTLILSEMPKIFLIF